MLNIILLTLVVVLTLFCGALLFYLIKLSQKIGDKTQDNDLSRRIDNLNQNVSQNLNSVTKNMMNVLQGTNSSIGSRLDNAAKVVGHVQERLGKMEESNQKIYEVGKDISTLQEILRAPKLRGVLGEFFLGDLLSQIFPKENFILQYGFKNGEKVDAVIKVKNDLIISIDSKFPLENFHKMIEAESQEDKASHRKVFHQDVKKHINAIAKKYILPDEGTFDFALMYIPAENVYYETVIQNNEKDENIMQYAFAKHVIPVSPNVLYVCMQAILMGLRGANIEKKAKNILSDLKRLNIDFNKFDDEFQVLGAHLNNASKKYDDSEKRLSKFGDKLAQVEHVENDSLSSEDEKVLIADKVYENQRH